MGRESQDTIDKLNAFIDSLPDVVRSKCALCSETLTHVVKKAEVETGAGTATVTRVLADRINDGAAPGDVVSDDALRDRVRRNEGTKENGRNAQIENKPTQKQQAPIATQIATETPGQDHWLEHRANLKTW